MIEQIIIVSSLSTTMRDERKEEEEEDVVLFINLLFYDNECFLLFYDNECFFIIILLFLLRHHSSWSFRNITAFAPSYGRGHRPVLVSRGCALDGLYCHNFFGGLLSAFFAYTLEVLELLPWSLNFTLNGWVC